MIEFLKETEYKGYYISPCGQVYSCKSRKFLVLIKHSAGYRTVAIDGKVYVHRLVAMAYLGNPEGLPMVNHIDEDKTNNHFL